MYIYADIVVIEGRSIIFAALGCAEGRPPARPPVRPPAQSPACRPLPPQQFHRCKMIYNGLQSTTLTIHHCMPLAFV